MGLDHSERLAKSHDDRAVAAVHRMHGFDAQGDIAPGCEFGELTDRLGDVGARTLEVVTGSRATDKDQRSCLKRRGLLDGAPVVIHALCS
jgi:hypothetical protein